MDAINQALQVAEGSGVNQGSKFRSRQTPQPNRSMGRNGTLGLPRRTMRTKLCVTQDGCSFRQSGQLNLQQMKDDIASMHSCELSGPSRRSLFLLLLPASAAGSACADEDGDDDGDFYTQWPYQKASDIIPYVESHSTPGDSESVLMAMDSFGERYPMWKLGPEKGAILEGIVKERDPQTVVELGTFLGYSAIRTARSLSSGARLVCVEGNAEYAAVARKLLDLAGVGDRVEIVVGLASEMLPAVSKKVPKADLIFEDHAKQCYAPDLVKMEALGMVQPGSWVVADNVVHPGAPGFLEHLVPSNGYESTELLAAAFEYEEPWREGDPGRRDDAISLSKFTGLPAEV